MLKMKTSKISTELIGPISILNFYLTKIGGPEVHFLTLVLILRLCSTWDEPVWSTTTSQEPEYETSTLSSADIPTLAMPWRYFDVWPNRPQLKWWTMNWYQYPTWHRYSIRLLSLVARNGLLDEAVLGSATRWSHFSTLHKVHRSTAFENLTDTLGVPGFEPGIAEQKALSLLLCYAVPIRKVVQME